jgi:hypothetical protein
MRTRFPFGALHASTAAVLLFASLAESQALTGSLFGTVKDETGAVLPGASVSVRSPALIGGRTATVTDEKGQFRFPSLTSGEYTLEVALSHFASYREDAIPIRVGGSLERIVSLQVAVTGADVVVQAQGSVVEAQRSGLSNRYGEEQLKSIPVRRYSMFDFIKAAPGVSPTSPSSGTDNSVSVFGSGGNENLFLLDGTNFTCPCSGGAAPQPDVDVIQEVQIDSLNASAEYGNIQGAVFNVVTKQGGNRLACDASYYGQWNGLTSHPVQLPCTRCSQPTTEYTRGQYRDFTTHVGGPILRDRLWFFGGYQYLRDEDSQPGTDPLFPRKGAYDKLFAKVTWQITARLKLMSSVHDEWWTSPERPTLSRPFETTITTSGSRPTMTFGELTHILSSSTLWDLRVSRFVAPQTSEPSTGNRDVPNRVDLATGLASGGPQQFGGLTLIRNTAKASLTHHQADLLGADHEFKVGAQVEKGEHFSYTAMPGGVRYTDNNGQPFQAIFREPFTTGGEFITTGLFASDAVRLARVTVNLGLRFDHNRAISQDLPERDVDGRETGQTIRGAGTLYTWDVLSPRLGLTAKLTSDGKTILRASYGRFHQGVLTGELAPVHPGLTPTTTAAFDPATGRYSRIISVVDPTMNVRIDPHMKSPRTDQFGIGLDRDLGHRLTVAAGYVHKTGADYIGWTDTGGVYRPETRTLADGRLLDVFVLANATADRRFLLTNPADYSLRYNGMLLAVEKRWARGWQALASYTLSKTEGLQPSSGTDPGGGQFSSTFGGGTFGRDPNTLTNAQGRLANDRTHKLGLMGSAEIPKTGLVVAGNLQYFTGVPWAATAQVSLPQGLQRVLLEPPGTRRVSSQTLLDLRLSRTFTLAGKSQVELLLDVLNALDDHAEERLADTNLFSQNFGRLSAFVDPRRAMLGVRVTLPK